jgi:type II secretion system protein N
VVAAARREADSLPAPLRLVVIPLAGLLLFLLFLHLRFPYDRLGGRIASQLGQLTQSQIQIGELAPRLSLAGPGLSARGVTAVTRSGARIQFERAFLRPAWSLAWLRANPAVFLDVAGPLGEADGVATLRVPGFHGHLRGIELAHLPLSAALPGSSLHGVADLAVDVEVGEAGPVGSTGFDVKNGQLGLPRLPIEVPFTSLVGELRFGGENLAELSGLVLEGPLVSARASGTLGRAARVEAGELKLTVDLTAQPGLRAPLQAAGIALAADGTAKLQVTGTPGQPQIR